MQKKTDFFGFFQKLTKNQKNRVGPSFSYKKRACAKKFRLFGFYPKIDKSSKEPRMKVEELKRELRALGKPVSGNKAVLTERLKQAKGEGKGDGGDVYTEQEKKVKDILEATGLVDGCGKLTTRKQFDAAIRSMGGMQNVLEVFGGNI